MVRYCDDFVCCFQYKGDAEKFYQELRERLGKFGLEISEEKSKIIPFGRFAEENNKRQGKGAPDTFDFLGFTHYCSTSRKGKFRVKRRTSRKKFKAKVREFRDWVWKARIMDMKTLWAVVRMKLTGHYNYYGVTDNIHMLNSYYYEVLCLLFKWLNRRSQKRSFNYEEFNRYLEKHPLPTPRIKVNIYYQT